MYPLTNCYLKRSAPYNPYPSVIHLGEGHSKGFIKYKVIFTINSKNNV